MDGGVVGFPAAVAEIIGREGETAAVIELVGRHRLVTLSGVGGTGKTRLALHVAASIGALGEGEVVFVDLTEAGASTPVDATISRQLGSAAAHATAIDALTSHIADRHLLLVLDNCEHVAAEAASVVHHLLSRTSRAAVLATSRVRLGVPGEALYRVPPLPVPPQSSPGDVGDYASVRLFLDCSRRAGAVVDIGTNEGDLVADICRQIDGLPLAIELAAAWTRALPLDAIAAGLRRRLEFLDDPARSGPARHQSLRACLEWSHALLTTAEQVAFRRLAVFAGPFDLMRAAAFVDLDDVDESAWLPALVGLLDKSLLSPTDPGQFRFLSTVRAFAREQLEASLEADAMHERHRAAVISEAAAVYPTPWLDRTGAGRLLVPRLDDLLAAFEWSEANAHADAICQLAPPLMAVLRRVNWWQVERISERVGAILPAASPIGRGHVIAAWAAWGTAWHPPVPLRWALQAAELFATSNDAARHALALVAASEARDCESTDEGDAGALAARAVDVARGAHDHAVLTIALLAHAHAQELVNGDAAVATMRTGIDEAAADPYLQATVRWELLQLLARQGDHNRADPEEEAVLEAGSDWRPDVMLHRGLVAAHTGGTEAAAYHATIWRQVLASRRPRPALDVLDSCIHLIEGIEQHLQGHLRAAARYYAEARQWLYDGAGIIGSRQAHYAYHWSCFWDLWCQLGLTDFAAATAVAEAAAARPFHGPNQFDSRSLIAAVEARHCGDFHRAERQARLLLALATPARRYDLIATATELAAGLVTTENPRQAARLFGAADGLRVRTGSQLRLQPLADWHSEDLERTRAELGTAFAAAYAEGETLHVDEIAAYARSGRIQRARARHGWESVTPAEHDVIRLVAAGLTNQEIAERLVVSPRTVASHLRRIFTKLDVRSRTDLARVALAIQDGTIA